MKTPQQHPNPIPFSSIPTNNEKGKEKKQRQSKGRQKIPISHIKDKNKRYVTFSKHRTGFFKKAVELSTLTGSSIAILTFTGIGKAFSFGYPDVDAIIQRYLSDQRTGHNNVPLQFYDHDEDDSALNLNYNQGYQESTEQTKEEEEDLMSGLMIMDKDGCSRGGGDNNKYRSNGDRGETRSLFWWEQGVDDILGLEELEQYMACLEQLKSNMATKAYQLVMMNNYYYDEATSNSNFFLPNLIGGKGGEIGAKGQV